MEMAVGIGVLAGFVLGVLVRDATRPRPPDLVVELAHYREELQKTVDPRALAWTRLSMDDDHDPGGRWLYIVTEASAIPPGFVQAYRIREPEEMPYPRG